MKTFKEKLKDPRAVLKVTVGAVVGFAVQGVVRHVITQNVEPESSLESARIRVGSIAIGLMAADAASNWTDNIIDQVSIEWHAPEDKPEEVATEEA